MSAFNEPDVVTRWRNGESYADIADSLGLKWTEVCNVVRRTTTPAERAARNATKARRNDRRNEEWVRRREAGESWVAIAKDYGVAFATVARTVSGIRPDLTDQERANALRRTRSLQARHGAAWAARYQAGESALQIAEAAGVSTTAVYKALRAHGCDLRSRADAGRKPHGGDGYKRTRTTAGYINTRIPKDHPYASAGYAQNESPHTVRILEHRLVMSEKLGRALRPDESVHHINGDRTDNRPENLELRQGRHGAGVAYRCLDCGSHNVETAVLSQPAPEPL